MESSDPHRYWVIARDKPGLLIAMMNGLAGDAHISFEGDLARCQFDEDILLSYDETDVLRRATLSPRQDFVVLSLEPNSVQQILDIVLPDRRCLEDIIHIQIAKRGKIAFGSYDNFHDECIVCYNAVPVDLLNRLQSSGVIRSWTLPNEGVQRWHG